MSYIIFIIFSISTVSQACNKKLVVIYFLLSSQHILLVVVIDRLIQTQLKRT
jgi:hypothetical protein